MRRSRQLVITGTLIAAWALPATAQATPTLVSVAPAVITVGQSTTASGSVSEAAAGQQIRVEENIQGSWVQVGATTTSTAAGAWSVRFNPSRSGAIRATQLTGSLGSSAELAIGVRPKVVSARTSRGAIYPFLGTIGVWKIAPSNYPNGTVVRIALSIDRRSAGVVRGRVKNGVVIAKLPTNGVGRFRTRIIFPNTATHQATASAALAFTITPQRVGSGSSRMWSKSLRAGLRFRGFHVPGGTSFDGRMGDSVVAFHKAYRKARTTTFEASDWKTLTTKRVVARDRSAPLHIEIDKSRQILMQVKNGKPIFIIHISSGATGNTPTGRHKIQWKGNYVPSLYGALLYRSMAFQGTFAIHGFPSVPTTPASHGCVRVPMWIANTLYQRTPVGTPVYVYQGPGGAATSVGREARTDVPELTGIGADRWATER